MMNIALQKYQGTVFLVTHDHDLIDAKRRRGSGTQRDDHKDHRASQRRTRIIRRPCGGSVVASAAEAAIYCASYGALKGAALSKQYLKPQGLKPDLRGVVCGTAEAVP